MNYETKNKHLTFKDRNEIQECLYRKMSFKAIGKLLGKDPTTISKEVKLHSKPHTNSFVKSNDVCPNLLKAPFVCNGCKLKNSAGCSFVRRVYTAKIAQEEYETTLIDSRTAVALNKSTFYENDRIISDKIKRGQHIYHIVSSPEVTISKSSVYRYFHKGYFSASIIDLPRAVKFKPRDKKHLEYVPKGVKIGRTYNDYVIYTENNNVSEHKEFDTVIGSIGGKVILTIHFTAQNFMFGLLLENKTSSEVSNKIIELKKKLSQNGYVFGNIFPVILTDNGGEFSDVATIECNNDGNEEAKVFFCDPMHSSQKPFIEKNHTLFRDIIPKSASFDDFTQETVNLIFSHVNSVKRHIYNGKTSYEMFAFMYSEELANLFGIHKIAEDKVIQSKALQTTKEFKETLKN